MRHGKALILLGLFLAGLAGCLHPKALQTPAWLERLRVFHGPSGPDVIIMDVAILQCPVGDKFIDHECWTFTDDQVIAMEQKAILEDNGFRIAQVPGTPPPGLQSLLVSDRHCINPRRRQLHAGNPVSVALGPPLASCRFQIQQDGQDQLIDLEQAQCKMVVTPTLPCKGKIALHFTPMVQYGQCRRLFKPAAGLTGWELEEHQPSQSYPDLSWDVTLAPNEYVVVGTRSERKGSLGYECFVHSNDVNPVQRLLVIRTSRSSAGIDADAIPGIEDDDTFNRSPPIALQASQTTVRGRER